MMTHNEKRTLKIYTVIISVLLLVLYCIIFTGCKTQKITRDYERAEKIELSDVSHSIKVQNGSSEFQNWSLDSLFCNFDVKILLYDTEKSIDSTTKKPPLKAEIDLKGNLAEKSAANTTEITHFEAVEQAIDSVEITCKEEEKETVKTKEYKPAWWERFVIVGVLILCILFCLKYYLK